MTREPLRLLFKLLKSLSFSSNTLIFSSLVFYSLFTPNVQGQQAPKPSLATIKVVAEQGDPIAQDRLGDAYSSWFDSTNALMWYRKAAQAGIANAQYHAAHILITKAVDLGGRVTNFTGVDEAIKWYFKSAEQNNKDAQRELGRMFETGKAVNRDFAEAYKWYSLAHMQVGLEVLAKVYLDQLILKMSQEQIEEGQRRVDLFLAGGGRELPEPIFVKKLKLDGISGLEKRRYAIINGHTFEVGEEAKVKVSGQLIKIRCMEIRKDSALVKADGVDRLIELDLR